jgi:hypothetical protein
MEKRSTITKTREKQPRQRENGSEKQTRETQEQDEDQTMKETEQKPEKEDSKIAGQRIQLKICKPRK